MLNAQQIGHLAKYAEDAVRQFPIEGTAEQRFELYQNGMEPWEKALSDRINADPILPNYDSLPWEDEVLMETLVHYFADVVATKPHVC